MTVQICPCEGLNSNCKKCFGSGYMNTGIAEKTTKTDTKIKKANESETLHEEAAVSESLPLQNKKEIQNTIEKMVAKLDLKSKQQMRMLHSIPFTTTTFRRDFKDKFDSFRIMEDEKRVLRIELEQLTKESIKKGLSVNYKFEHLLSDKDIDVTSNRELKTLMREYKKLNK
jgi:hypothetical protein